MNSGQDRRGLTVTSQGRNSQEGSYEATTSGTNTPPPTAKAISVSGQGLTFHNGELFSHVYRQLKPVIAGMLARLDRTTTHQEREDMVHEVFLRTWRMLARSGRKVPTHYVVGVARNILREYQRHRRRRRVALVGLGRLLTGRTMEPTSPPESHEMFSLVAVALGKLSHHQRQALVMVYMKGLSIAEAAKRGGCTPGAMTIRVHRARCAIRVLITSPQARR